MVSITKRKSKRKKINIKNKGGKKKTKQKRKKEKNKYNDVYLLWWDVIIDQDNFYTSLRKRETPWLTKMMVNDDEYGTIDPILDKYVGVNYIVPIRQVYSVSFWLAWKRKMKANNCIFSQNIKIHSLFASRTFWESCFLS